VQGRAALWSRTEDQPVVVGLRTDVRDVLVTTLLDAQPDHRHRHPRSTIWPLLAALATGVTFILLVFTPWGLPIGGALLTLALLGWAWPDAEERREMELYDRPV
jgi:cytochrome c oxidase subunit I+III